MTTHEIQELFDREPHLYDRLASDRDFAAEVLAIRRMSRSASNFEEIQQETILELFAGPAWHAARWKHQFRAKVLAVDSSPGMKDLAVSRGRLNFDEYIVGRLPGVLASRCSNVTPDGFDIALILRYSCGYLSNAELTELLSILSRLIKIGGRIVLELHDPRMLASDLGRLPIRIRTFAMEDGSRLSCKWPSGAIRWLRPYNRVEMPVTIEHTSSTGSVRRLNYVSREYIYRFADIQHSIGPIPTLRVDQRKISTSRCFKHSHLISLIRSIE
jgi:SAM-dependent methyltransferase